MPTKQRKHLRPYQSDILNKLKASQDKNTLVVMPAGSGKTLIEARFAEHLIQQNLKVVVLSMQVQLRAQLQRMFEEEGITDVVFTSSLVSEQNQVKEADVFIVDEAHHAVTDTHINLFNRFPNAKVYGFTATAERNDDLELGDVFEEIIQSDVTTEWLIRHGYLSKFHYYAPSNSPIALVSQDNLDAGGGYILDERENIGKTIYGDVIRDWTKNASDRQTIVFAPNIETSKIYAERFNDTGVKAVHVDSKMPHQTVAKEIEAFRRGDYQVLCNHNIISEGFDMNEVGCVVLTYPTKSFTLFYQRVCRALRKNDNQVAIVLDHGDNVYFHGRIDDFKNYTLQTSDEVENERKRNAIFERANTDFYYFEDDSVELVEVYRYRSGYNSKYNKLIEKANKLANVDGLSILFDIQKELKIQSAPGLPAWALAFATNHGYDLPTV